MLRKIVLGALLVLLSPLIAVLIAAAMVLVVMLHVHGWAALRRYCRRNRCWTFLVCSPRRGWHEFLSNNALAALPEGIHAVWTQSGEKPTGEEASPPSSLIWAGKGLSKPYLAQVRTIGVTVRSLHDRLLPLKQCAKKDAEVQTLLRKILESELRGA